MSESNLERLVCLNPDVTDLIIQNRTEGPLTPEMIQFGYPNILKEADEETQTDNWYSKQVILFNEAVIIQKLTWAILININKILGKVSDRDKKVKKIRGTEYDFYRIKLFSDFINNEDIKQIVEKEACLHPEFKSMAVKDIILKCIVELEREGYVEREDASNVESIKEDYIYFTDKRKDLYNFVFEQIRESGDSGLEFKNLCNDIKSRFSKFYNMELIFTAIDFWFEESKIIESEKHVYQCL